MASGHKVCTGSEVNWKEILQKCVNFVIAQIMHMFNKPINFFGSYTASYVDQQNFQKRNVISEKYPAG